MTGPRRFVVVSDIHYASAAEQARGDDYETRPIPNPFARWFLQVYRRIVWLREPLRKNYLLDKLLGSLRGDGVFLVANGDYSCDSGFIGVADDAALQSTTECLAKLRGVFGTNVSVTWGDHDLGKKDFFGKRGGMRLESARRLTSELGVPPFWIREWDETLVMVGISSSLVALGALETEILPEEKDGWLALRSQHMQDICMVFEQMRSDQRLILFCHDPTALPFLYEEPIVRAKLHHLERTVIGHLHSPFILKMGNHLAGMPEISWLGHTVRKLSRALNDARLWKPFNVALCPSLAGMELLKDGGYSTLTWDKAGSTSRFSLHRLPR